MKEKILHLTLKKKWFDMVLSGEKKEEYREFKEYWIRRLCYFEEWPEDFQVIQEMIEDLDNDLESFYDIDDFIIFYGIKFKKFTHIVFTNGYGKDRPSFKIAVENLTIDIGVDDWGAEKFKFYLTFKLGEIKKLEVR